MTILRTRAVAFVVLVACRPPAVGDSGTSPGSSSSDGSDSSSVGGSSESSVGISGSESGDSGSGGEAVEVTTLAYGDSAAQTLDLYLPQPRATPSLPTLVLAHGGLWQGGSKEALDGLCRQVVLGSDGDVACASIGYRLSQDLRGLCTGGPDTYEEQLRDFGAAVVLLQNQAAIHGLDPARMFVGGHSAGGHLAHALNLRWAEFTPGPSALAAIGIEGIYDVAAWDAYDQSWWNGMFSCATHKAFGDPPDSPTPCIDPQFQRPCWEVGSPTWLASNAEQLGLAAVGNALMIHSPADDWVDIAQAAALGDALAAAFPERTIIVSDDGTCAAGGHNPLLDEPALAGCLVAFVRSGGTTIEP